ncbi:glycosyltransferase family 4 protein [Candidatus Beckwithbacteria bacterium]|nr:glycosyltransferase family 4 protein [Candidatus Beckwithbacteria bacterium]
MKNIGIDCRFWGIKHAGLGRYTRELVLSILRQNQDFAFTLFFQKGDFGQDQKLLKNHRIVEVEIPHYSLKEQLFFGQIVDRQKLNFVHFMHFNVPMFLQTPFVVTIHDLIKHFFKGKPVTTRSLPIYWLKYGGYRLIIGKAIKNAKEIIVPSYFTKDQITLEYPEVLDEKIHVIYEGVSSPYDLNSKLKT